MSAVDSTGRPTAPAAGPEARCGSAPYATDAAVSVRSAARRKCAPGRTNRKAPRGSHVRDHRRVHQLIPRRRPDHSRRGSTEDPQRRARTWRDDQLSERPSRTTSSKHWQHCCDGDPAAVVSGFLNMGYPTIRGAVSVGIGNTASAKSGSGFSGSKTRTNHCPAAGVSK